MIKLFNTLALVLLSVFTWSQEHKDEVIYRVYSYVDETGEQDYSAIQSKEFKPLAGDYFNLGISSAVVWVRVDIESSHTSPIVLVVNGPLLDTVLIQYENLNGGLTQKLSGLMIDNSKKDFDHYTVAMSIDPTVIKESIVYLRMSSRYSLQGAVTVLGEKEFLTKRVDDYMLAGLFFGALIIIMFYNLFLYIKIRDVNYLLYVLGLFCAIITQASLKGFASQYLTSEYVNVTYHLTSLFIGFCTIFFILFSISFLKIKKYSVTLFYMLYIVLFFAVLMILMELTWFDVLAKELNIWVAISGSVLMLLSGYVSWFNGNKAAKYFSVAWTFFLMAVIVFALKTAGVIPANFYTNHLIDLGAILEVLFLSFALGDRYNKLKREKELFQIQNAEKLEELVSIRTEELQLSIQDKEVLLKEVHHRVKNNLQIIISLLDLQVNNVKDEKSKEVLLQSMNRIASMSLIHQKLYQSNDFHSIELRNYILELVEHIKGVYDTNDLKLTIVTKLDNVSMSLTKAIPIGIILTELLTNSFKHGVVLGAENCIEVTFEVDKNNAVITVSDDGVGFVQEEAEAKGTLGLFLVNMLVGQIGGKYSYFKEGTRFTSKIDVSLE